MQISCLVVLALMGQASLAAPIHKHWLNKHHLRHHARDVMELRSRPLPGPLFEAPDSVERAIVKRDYDEGESYELGKRLGGAIKHHVKKKGKKEKPKPFKPPPIGGPSPGNVPFSAHIW